MYSKHKFKEKVISKFNSTNVNLSAKEILNNIKNIMKKYNK